MNASKHILTVIVFAQFCCTSLWFAGNAVMDALIENFNLSASAIGHLTSAVQFGFIFGAFLFALLCITDRFSPSKVFFICALIAAAFNLMIVLNTHTMVSLLIIRFFTGFFLAGIYPVGMKIASDYYQAGLGKSLGYLVGALVLGTACPSLIQGFNNSLSWEVVIWATSALSVLGGLFMVFFVPNGPFRKRALKLDFSAVINVFKQVNFRQAAFGYFGHMWELYAFWAFLPVWLWAYQKTHANLSMSIPLISFMVIASGGIACVLSGYLCQSFGAKRIATITLILSGVCCLVSPFVFSSGSEVLFISFLVCWGMLVIADSPLFSTLVADNAILEYKGTALTIVNAIGFAITIVSIQILNELMAHIHAKYLFLPLTIGPVFGVLALMRRKKLH